jgi:2-octaprenylphenol hydroxylase
MQKFDLLIVGGGMVGLTLALAVRQQSNLTVAIVDTQSTSELSTEPEVRVSAINMASQQIFDNLMVWPLIEQQRLHAYEHMHIWDKNGYGKLHFSHTEVAEKNLGWIIENKVIRNALWKKAEEDEGITFYTEQALTSLGMGESEVFASFAQGIPISAKLAVGADGAHSWVREQMAMGLAFQDYDHHAIVATIKVANSHENTAWQVFLADGPLAFLPLYQDNLCSIVWSTSPQESERLMALSDVNFSKALTGASDGKLGKINVVSKRFNFPLTMRLAHNFVKDKVILVGDAAHTIHPLAGQGVNLGLLDAAALADTIIKQTVNQQDINNSIALNHYARWRRTEASEMIAAMATIKTLFSHKPLNLPHEPVRFFRGIGMSMINNFSAAKKLMIKQALGYKAHLPELAKKKDNLLV